MLPKRNLKVCGMVSAVLSDSSSPLQWRKPGLDITVYVRVGDEKEGEKRKKMQCCSLSG